jgi:hypothetical protein
MHGHWNANASDIDMIMDEDHDTEKINTGIRIVIPAQKMLETIQQPKLEEMRRAMEAEIKFIFGLINLFDNSVRTTPVRGEIQLNRRNRAYRRSVMASQSIGC